MFRGGRPPPVAEKEGLMDAISWQLLIEGAWTTLWISAIAIAFGVVAGC